MWCTGDQFRKKKLYRGNKWSRYSIKHLKNEPNVWIVDVHNPESMQFISQLKSPGLQKVWQRKLWMTLSSWLSRISVRLSCDGKNNSTKPCLTLTSPVENNLELLSTPDKGTEVFIFSTKWSRSSFRAHYFGWPLKIHEQTELSQRDLLGDYLRLGEYFEACISVFNSSWLYFSRHVMLYAFFFNMSSFHISACAVIFPRSCSRTNVFHIICILEFPGAIFFFFLHKFSFIFTLLIHSTFM